MNKTSLIILALFLFVGCGYKPSTYYAKQQISGNVFVNMHISIEDPKSSVIIKDNISETLVNKLGARLVSSKKLANTIVEARIKRITMQVLQYDEAGFEKLYRATVEIEIKYSSQNKKDVIVVKGIDDFVVDGVDGEISETKRFEAINNASRKALEEVVAKIAIQTFKKN